MSPQQEAYPIPPISVGRGQINSIVPSAEDQELELRKRKLALRKRKAQAKRRRFEFTQTQQPQQPQMQPQAVPSGRPVPPSQPSEAPPPDWMGRGNAALQGLTWGTADEIGILAAALVAKAVTGDDFADIYTSMRDSESDKRAKYKKENPTEALAFEIGGGLASGAGLYDAGRKATAAIGSKVSQAGARKRLQKTLGEGGQGKGLEKAMANTLGIGKGQTGKTMNRKMEKALTAIAAAGGVGAVEAFIYAFNSGDGDFDQRFDAGTKAAKMGAVVGGGIGAASEGVKKVVEKVVKPKLAQSLGEGDEFVPYTVASGTDTGLTSFYDSVVKSSYGSRLKPQVAELNARMQPHVDEALEGAQADVARANESATQGARVAEDTRLAREASTGDAIAAGFKQAKRAVEDETDTLKRSVLNKSAQRARDINATAKDQIQASADTAEEMTEAANMAVQNKLFNDAAPINATPAQREALANPDPYAAMDALQVMRKDNGFTALNDTDYLVDQQQVIANALEVNKKNIGTDKHSKAIAEELELLIKNRLSMTGHELMAVRNQLRVRVNDTGLGAANAQTKTAYANAAKSIDKQLKGGIPKDKQALYTAELNAYASTRHLEDSMHKAVQEGGSFDARNMIAALPKSRDSITGTATGQADALELKKLQKSIDAQKAQRETETALQKEQAIVTEKTRKADEVLQIAGTKQARLDEVTAATAQAKALRKRDQRADKIAQQEAKHPQVTVQTSDKGLDGIRKPHMRQTAGAEAKKVLTERGKVPSTVLPRIGSTLALPSMASAVASVFGGATGGVGGALAGAAGGFGGGVLAANTLSRKGVQKALAGDTKMQKRIAEMLRKEPHTFGRGSVLRPSINDMLDDEERRQAGGY